MVMITNCEEQRKPEIQYNCKMNECNCSQLQWIPVFLYNGLGLKGLECTETHYKGSEIVIDVQYAKLMRQGT